MKLIREFSEEYLEYLRDESRLSGKAEYIAFPETEAEIKEIAAHCRSEKIPLTIQGSRTGITGGSVPAGGLILNLEKFNRVTGIRHDEKGNWFLRCQPGLKLLELRAVLAGGDLAVSGWSDEQNQLWKRFRQEGEYIFPPDPTEATASLGGIASCNASGARSLKYGAARQWINALKTICLNSESRFMESSHTIRLPNAGVKNAAGYYLAENRRDFDHFIGAEGTLGIITELELRLIEKPAYCWAVMQFFAEESQAVLFSENLVKSGSAASAIEYFGYNALDLLRANRQLWQELPDLQDKWKCAVYYEFEGDNQRILEEAVFAAGELAEESGSSQNDCWFVDNSQGVQRMKEFRHALPEAINRELDGLRKGDQRLAKISTDLAVPSGCLKEMIKLYRTAEQQHFKVIVFGHIGNNHLHTNILPGDFQEYLQGKALAESWAKRAVALGGSVSGEHGIGKVKVPLLEMMYGSKDIALFRRLKNRFDPEWLLNRGNVIKS
jgi:D-lactate dehydrogenase (cytochrome)